MTLVSDHERTVRERHGFDAADFALGDLPASSVDRRFACASDADAVAAAPDRATKVCTGVGMTGPPHLGTLAQLHLACDLQRAGLDVQFVLADLEPYHDGVPLDRVRRLAARYRSLALELGFDPDRGELRTQSEGAGAMRTAAVLAPHYPPPDGPDHPETGWETAVREMYDARATDREGPTSEAAATLSGLLHLSDFLHPLRAEGYERVVVLLGADECGLSAWAGRALDAMPVDGGVAGLHTRLIPAADAPKMSKSVGVGVHLGMAPDAVRAGIRDLAAAKPHAAFRAMCLASDWDGETLDRVERAKDDGGEAWDEWVGAYADEVAAWAAVWGR